MVFVRRLGVVIARKRNRAAIYVIRVANPVSIVIRSALAATHAERIQFRTSPIVHSRIDVVIARARISAAQNLAVTNAVAVFIRLASPSADSQRVKLVAVAVAVSRRDV